MTIVYAIAVWLICGFVAKGWWIQIGCFALTTLLMVELNNMNVLIRVYSRMVSCAFLTMFCCASFLFPSAHEGIMITCMTVAYLILFQGYQDKMSMGKTFYAFFSIGLASMAYVQTLFFVPVLWILMTTNLLSLSWRTWLASLIGIVTPYWFAACWMLHDGDFSPLFDHFSTLIDFQFPIDYSILTINQKVTFLYFLILAVIGAIHFSRRSYNDKIRIRMYFRIFILMDLLAATVIFLQPQYFNGMLLLIIINTAPLIAHFIALTNTKVTNITFIVLVILTFLLTVFNAWSTLSLS